MWFGLDDGGGGYGWMWVCGWSGTPLGDYRMEKSDGFVGFNPFPLRNLLLVKTRVKANMKLKVAPNYFLGFAQRSVGVFSCHTHVGSDSQRTQYF